MDDLGQVPVPRSLRVASTIQILGKRLPMKTAIVGMVLVVLWGMISFAGGDMVVTGEVLLGVGVIASVVLEGRWGGGYDTLTVLSDLARVLREPRYLEWQPQTVEVAAERATVQPSAPAALRPRWQTSGDRPQEQE